MSNIELDYVRKYYTKHLKLRYEFRPPKRAKHFMKNIPLPGRPGSAEFMTAYAKATAQLDNIPEGSTVGAARVKPGSMAALIAAYKESRVITNCTRGRIDVSPTLMGKLSYWPRSKRFRSISLPRFRSHPIQPFSRGL